MKFISKLKFADLKFVFYTLLSFIPGKILKVLKNDIWIISERECEANDNGYWLYKYICLETTQENVFYAIGYNSDNLLKVNKLGRTINFGSFMHHIYTWAAKKYISTQYSNGFPSRIMYYAWLKNANNLLFYFLQHGVTKDKSYYLEEPSHRVKLMCCTNKNEAAFVESMGYSHDAVRITGFSRFDGLNNQNIQKQILIMPTWRKYLQNVSKSEFIETEFFIKFDSLINSNLFRETLDQYKVLFCLHPGFDKYRECFFSNNKNVKVISCNDIPFQDLINDSCTLITDFSSIAFDFAYLNRTVFYYQFDTEEFREKHLQDGYYDYEKDGFGPVFNLLEELEKYLKKYKLKNRKKYVERQQAFFKDLKEINCYCKEIYDHIKFN